MRDLAEEIVLDKNKKHDLDVVVDRLVLKEGIRQRLRDSLETAARLSEGLVLVQVGEKEEILFSERYACPICGVSIPELTPRLFSFNSPYGACPDCGGLGNKMFFDEQLVIPDPTLSLREGAIAPWEGRDTMAHHQMVQALADHFHFSLNTAFCDLPETVQRVLLYGSGEEEIKFAMDRNGRRVFYYRPFEG